MLIHTLYHEVQKAKL